jgi:hypothetical protein
VRFINAREGQQQTDHLYVTTADGRKQSSPPKLIRDVWISPRVE